MRFTIALLLCLVNTGAFSKDNIIEKMASAVCACMQKNLQQQANLQDTTSYTYCVIEHLEPHKHSLKKLIKHIIRTDNKGEDLKALDDFHEDFEEAMNRKCPGLSFDYTRVFNEILK